MAAGTIMRMVAAIVFAGLHEGLAGGIEGYYSRGGSRCLDAAGNNVFTGEPVEGYNYIDECVQDCNNDPNCIGFTGQADDEIPNRRLGQANVTGANMGATARRRLEVEGYTCVFHSASEGPTPLTTQGLPFLTDYGVGCFEKILENTCVDNPAGWIDSEEEDCGDHVAAGYCTSSGGYGWQWDPDFGVFEDYINGGYTAPVACCACGGGAPVCVDSDHSSSKHRRRSSHGSHRRRCAASTPAPAPFDP